MQQPEPVSVPVPGIVLTDEESGSLLKKVHLYQHTCLLQRPRKEP
uniref:Uncharacterized protein n=1 Tax=Anguilla anguilla TaxID=7936 RepID=A0A0E9SB44_ANGAN